MKLLTTVLALAVCGAALAQDPRGVGNEPGYAIPGYRDSGASRGPMGPGRSYRGEVEAIDKISGTITLRHDSIEALGVPARTMDYPVKDSSMLENVKVGDRVRFGAVLQGRSLLVTTIGPAN